MKIYGLQFANDYYLSIIPCRTVAKSRHSFNIFQSTVLGLNPTVCSLMKEQNVSYASSQMLIFN